MHIIPREQFDEKCGCKVKKMEKKVLILVGHSGSGKTTMARAIKRLDRSKPPGSKYGFLSTGDDLRELGILPRKKELGLGLALGLIDLKSVNEKCYELIREAIETFSKDESTLLVLDAIKSLADAQFVVNTLREFNLNSFAVMYLDVKIKDLGSAIESRDGGYTNLLGRRRSWHRHGTLTHLSLEKVAKWKRHSYYITEYLSRNGADVFYFDPRDIEEYDTDLDLGWSIRMFIELLIEFFVCFDCMSSKYHLFGSSIDTLVYKGVKHQGTETNIFVSSKCKRGHVITPPKHSLQGSAEHLFSSHFSPWKKLLPQNWHALVLGAKSTIDVMDNLFSTLNVKRFDFMLPAAFVSSSSDVDWVAYPSRYYVTHKSDGVRYLLYKMKRGKMFLLNRAKELFKCELTGHFTDLPDGTVLDGELVNHQKADGQSSVFIAFDILSLGHRKQWHLKLEDRQLALESTGLEEEPEVFRNVSLFQKTGEDENQGIIRIFVARKKHLQSTPQQIKLYIENFDSFEAGSIDGLIFTPNMAYTFGPDQFIFKWQPAKQITFDIFAGDLDINIVHRDSYQETDVLECIWETEEDNKGTFGNHDAYRKQSETLTAKVVCVRSDKILPNSKETVERTKELIVSPFTEDDILEALDNFTSSLGSLIYNNPASSLSLAREQIHPSLLVPFDELYENIMEEVKNKNVEKITDKSTGLEIFNYYQCAPLDHITVCMCRGLVIDPNSKSMVTKPFIRFFEQDFGPGKFINIAVYKCSSLGL